MKRFYHLYGTYAKILLACVAAMQFLPMNARPSSIVQLFANNCFEISKSKSESLLILLPENATKDELEAANLLKKHISNYAPAANILIAARNSKVARGSKTISISKDPDARVISPLFDDFSKTVSNSIHVTPDKVELQYCLSPQNAVGSFLQELGFKFYTPTELGTVMPSEGVKLQAGKKEFTSNFLHIDMHGIADKEWLLLNGARNPLPNFSHNLSRIFTQDSYEAYPEFKPQLKKYQNKKNAQPNFTAEGASIFAAQKADEFFPKNPNSLTFSVGINDSLVFDKRIRKNKAPTDFFRNYPNYSDEYFSFAAATARVLSRTDPEKFIGCLAYLSTEAVPNFRLPPNLYPVLTSDRASNFNVQKKYEDFKLIELWAKSGVKVAGIYDYLYGFPYYVPRSIEKFAWEGIAHAKKCGIRSYFAETSPDWPYDGARLWVAMQMLNGSKKSPSELESSYYKDMYPNSNEAIAGFFLEAKSAWEKRTDTPHWLSFYKRDAVAELFPPEKLKRMEDFLSKAEKRETDASARKRLFQLRISFETSKAFCEYYLAQKSLFLLSENSRTEEILKALEDAKKSDDKFSISRTVKSAANAYKTPPTAYKKEFEAPIDTLALLCMKKSDSFQKEKLKSIIGEKAFKAVSDALEKTETVFFTNFNYPEYAADTEGVKEFPGIFRTKHIENKASDFRIKKTENGNTAYIKNCTYAEIVKFLPVDQSKTHSFKFTAKSRISISTTAYASLIYLDKNGGILARREVSIPPFDQTEKRTYEILLRTPESAKYAAIAVMCWNMHDPKDFLQIESVEFSSAAN